MRNELSQFGAYAGQNFAPVKPFFDLKDGTIQEKTVTDHYLVKEIRTKYEELINRNKSSWREMICAGEIIALFIEGEQILRINEFNGMPKIEKPNLKDPMHVKCINKMQLPSTMWQDKWHSSKADILLTPFSNQDEAIAQAHKANSVVDYLESKFFTTWFDLQEGLNAQIWGWYGRRVRPDFTSKAFHTFKEILGEKEIPIGKPYGKCECGYRGEEVKKQTIGKKEFDACPECDSLEYDFTPPIMQLTKGVVRREKVFLPEIICEPLLFPSVRFDLSKKAEESSWFIVEKKIEECVLRRILGNIRFPEGESGNDFGLETIDFLAARGSALNGSSSVSRKGGNEQDDKRVTLSEMYLSSDDLYDIKIGGGEKTVEGETLPKNKRMSDVFPDGCCVIGINGMALILGIYAGHHSDSVTSGVYHMKAASGAGRGVSDAVEVQKQFNRRYSQIDKFMAARGTPPILATEGAIEDRYKKLFAEPGAVIPIKLQNFPDVKDVRQLIANLQGESVPGDLVHITFDRLDDMLKTAFHITGLGGLDSQGVKQDTATYWQLNDSNANSIFSPVTSGKAETNVNTVKKGFYQWTHFTPEARFIPFKKQNKSGSYGIEISGKEVDAEYIWSYVPGSEAPKNRFTETQKRMAFFSQFQGGISGWLEARQMMPKHLAEIERDFDVNFETDSYDMTGEVCRLRWERAKTALKEQTKRTDMPDYLGILFELEPSIEITEPVLPEQVLWYQNLLMTEEGQAMPRVERELVSMFILALKKLADGQSLRMQLGAAEIEVAAQKPFVDAQNEQNEQQNAIQQEQQSQQMIGDAVGMALQNEGQESAQAHEQELSENEDAMEAVAMLHEANQNEQQRKADAKATSQKV